MTMSNISVAEEPAANMAWKSNLGKKEALCCLTGRDRGAAFVTLDSVMFTVKKLWSLLGTVTFLPLFLTKFQRLNSVREGKRK